MGKKGTCIVALYNNAWISMIIIYLVTAAKCTYLEMEVYSISFKDLSLLLIMQYHGCAVLVRMTGARDQTSKRNLLYCYATVLS